MLIGLLSAPREENSRLQVKEKLNHPKLEHREESLVLSRKG